MTEIQKKILNQSDFVSTLKTPILLPEQKQKIKINENGEIGITDKSQTSNYQSYDLENRIVFNNPLSPVSCQGFRPELGCDITAKENNLSMIGKFGTESPEQAITDVSKFLESNNLIPKVQIRTKEGKLENKSISTLGINYEKFLKPVGETSSENGKIILGNEAFKSKGLLRAVVLHELLHRKDFVTGNMFKDTVYNRHMKIYPEVIKDRYKLGLTDDDNEIYMDKFISIRDNNKNIENWTPSKIKGYEYIIKDLSN